MAKQKATSKQRKEIATLTRRANRRIERATPGQRNYLESFVRRITGGQSKFSAASAKLSEREAEKKLQELRTFLGPEDKPVETTTRKGWERLKNKGVETAGATWRNKLGYSITDEELAVILQQEDIRTTKDLYRAVNLVEARKEKLGDEWDGTEKQIGEAIALKYHYKAALKRGLKAKEARQKREAAELQNGEDIDF